MVSNASDCNATFTASLSSGESRGGGWGLRVRSGFDARLVTASLEKPHQSSPRDRGCHCVDERVIVQKLVGEHGGVEHNRNFAVNIVDRRERSDAARFHPQQLPQRLGRSEREPSFGTQPLVKAFEVDRGVLTRYNQGVGTALVPQK